MKYIDYMDSWRKPNSKYDDYAYQVDGGANDEGYYFKWCPYCRRDAEHELDVCLDCEDTARIRASKSKSWQEY